MVLDPFEVEDDWFEVILPSLQLVLTVGVPDERREIAVRTLQKLHLRDDERIVRQRRRWYELFQGGHIDLECLRKNAPLIARAVERALPAEESPEPTAP